MKLSIFKKRKVKYATAIATCIAIANISLITVNANAPKVSNNSNSVIDKFVNTAANEIGQGRDENNITKYGQWYEDNIDNTDRFAPAPWCAMFISWCANEAGLSEDVIGYYAECSYWKNGFYVKNDLWHDAEGYTPKKGDLLFFDNHYEDGVADHNGIVEDVTDNEVIVIEGNYNDKVARVTYTLNDNKILGYGTPNYTKSKTTSGTRQHIQNPNQTITVTEVCNNQPQQQTTGSQQPVSSSTGAQKMLDVARAEIGTGESGEWTKYGQWYQDNIDGSWNFATAEWCAMFVSWCANEAGFSDIIIPYASCYAGEANFANMGGWHPQGSGYVPKPGDIIFFTGGSHTGIVEKVENGVIYTIEGNYLETVARGSHNLNAGNISGFGSPRY